jgi:GNAT superfamily N-acetyltransferase
MVATLAGGTGNVDAVIAIRDGLIIGHAMAADRAGPAGTLMTDIGVVVADAWQGHGVGGDLTRALLTAAQARGVISVAMDVLHSNSPVLAMIASHWPAARTGHGADMTTVQVRLTHPLQQWRPV